MTTETRRAPSASSARGVGVLGRSALVASAAGLLLTAVGLLAGGRDAGLAGVLGTVVTGSVLLSGALVVDLVSRQQPRLSLLVALTTYAVQVGLFAVLLAAVTGAGGLEDDLALPWLAGAVIAVALTWTVAQVVLSVRARIPAFDLPDDPSPQDGESSVRGLDETRTRGV